MIQRREIALCIVLSVITCGLYSIYWFICLTNESNELCPENATASGGVALLLTFVTCGIYMYYWAYKTGEKLDIAKEQHGLPNGSGNILYLLLTIFGLGIVAYALMQNDINQIVG